MPKMLKRILPLLLLVTSFALAHSGYKLVIKDGQWATYTLTLLEDTHLQEGKLQLRLFLKLKQNTASTMLAPELTLRLEQNGEVITEPLLYLGLNSDEGKQFYDAYFLDLPLSHVGDYQAELSSSAFAEPYSFALKVVPQARFSLKELLPSLFILFIFFLGLGFLYYPRIQFSDAHAFQKGLA